MTSEAERSQLFDALAEEFLGRVRAGERPSVSDYAERHPAIGSEVRQLFPALLLLEEAGAGLAERPAPPPEQLGDYRLLRPIGRGGMGEVYLAEQLSLRRQVALKLLRPQLATSESALRRFQVEAASAARLHHPGIVQIHAVGKCDDHHFISMEYVEGCSLQDVLDKLRSKDAGRRDASSFVCRLAPAGASTSTSANGSDSYEAAAARLVATVADALQHAHDAGITHRDVKPSNILLRVDGTAVLSDFGLARDADLPSLTNPGVFAGTPNYSSPEQAAAGKVRPDARSDVFSLGVTLFELLTLRLPFEGSSSSEVLHAIVHHDPLDPRRHNRRVPRDLATIVLTALQKAPESRYQSAGALAADLRRFLADEPIVARPASMLTRAVKLVRRHRAAAAAAAVVLVGASAGAGWWFSRPGEVMIPGLAAGVAVYVDGVHRADARPGRPLAMSPGPHTLYLLADDGRSMSRRREIEVPRWRKDQELVVFDVAQVVESIRKDSFREDWPASGALDAEIDKALREDQVEAGEQLAQGMIEATTRLLGQMQRLDADAPETKGVLGLLARAVEQQERVDSTDMLVAEKLEDGTPQQLLQALRAIDDLPLTLGSLPFTPAVECRRQRRDDIARQALKRGMIANDLDVVGQHEGVLARVYPDPEHADRLTLRGHAAALKQDKGLLDCHRVCRELARRADRDGLRAQWQQMRALDRNDVRTREAGDWLQQLQEAEEWLLEMDTSLLRAFTDDNPGQLSELQTRTQRRAVDIDAVSSAMAERLRQRGRDLGSAVSFLASLRELRTLAETDPEAAREQLAQLPDDLPPELASVASDHLRPQHEATFGLLSRCRDIERACQQRDLHKAKTLLQRLLQEGPDARHTRVLTAQNQVQRLESEEQARLGLDPVFGQFREQIAARRFENAAVTLGRLQEGWRSALARCDTAITRHQALQLLLLRAELHLLLDDPEKALADARNADTRVPTPEAKTLAGMALYRVAIASTPHDARRLDEALKLLTAGDPEGQDALVWYWRGVCWQALLYAARDAGDDARVGEAFEHADAAFTRSRQLGFDGADLHTRTAEMVYQDNRPHAGTSQERALRVISICNTALASPVSADEVLANPDGAANASTLRSRIHYLRAAAHTTARLFSEAVEDWTVVLSIDPKDYDSRSTRGYALLELGRLGEARADLETALEQSRHDPKVQARIMGDLSRLKELESKGR